MSGPELEGRAVGELVGKVCAICQTALAHGDEYRGCGTCSLPYHAECWTENRGCATYGCKEAPVVPKQHRGAGPWNEKLCPSCGQAIPKTALACKHCRARFPSSEPMDAADYMGWYRSVRENELVRRQATIALLAGMLACITPFNLLGTGIWWYANRERLDRVGGLTRVMGYASVMASAAFTVVLLLVVLVS